MENMNFTKLNIYTTSEDLEPLMSRLEDLGVSGFEIHDASDFENFLTSGVKNWDYVGEELEPLKTQETRVTLYFTTDKQGKELLAAICEACAGLRMEQSEVREEDWADSWKKHFKPLEVGKRLIIKPTWESVPENNGSADAARLILEIDPASAFGTGQHESTKLCLETLESLTLENSKFLDIGCGSGILTIGALLLGAGSAVMVDVSENAVKVACENLMLNGFAAASFCGDITESAELLKQIGDNYDVIAANIVADVIIKMGGIFPKLLKAGGILITSGIIESRLDEVVENLAPHLKIIEIKKDNGWCLILSCRI
ncbi:MAG: 50S ribosomal protein L11 methyltransferase [Oscillospiraceae bacterium]|jgi:ribosomal protein L11 methyltransferase|nr:50S ribosomal protein L11 methyltransferase [Oscillospiraceae bacterium]